MHSSAACALSLPTVALSDSDAVNAQRQPATESRRRGALNGQEWFGSWAIWYLAFPSRNY